MKDKNKTKKQLIKELKEVRLKNKRLEEQKTFIHDEQENHRRIIENMKGGYFRIDLEGNLLTVSNSLGSLLGYTQQELEGQNIHKICQASKKVKECLLNLRKRNNVQNHEIKLKHKNGKILNTLFTYQYVNADDEQVAIEGLVNDITFIKNIDSEKNIVVELLKVLDNNEDLATIFKKVSYLIQSWSGCDAVGIRLKEDDDYPYFETRGFPEDFIELENSLCAVDQEGEKIRDSEGNPVLECMCGNVIYGRYNPELPFFTENGSFWTNSTSHLLASTGEEDRQARTRNRCNGEGYESVALIPLRYKKQNLGLLQFNNYKPDQFDIQMIKQLERLAFSLAPALAERKKMKKLLSSEKRFHTLFNNLKDAVIVHELNFSKNQKPGKIKMANRAASQMTGYTRQELKSLSPWELELTPMREKYWPSIRRQLQEEGNAFFESKLVTKNDQEIAIEVNANTFELNDKNHLISIIRDCSDRKQIETELRKNKEKYQALYENAPIPYQSLSKNAKIIDVNPTWLRTLGYVRGEVIGKNFLEFLHPESVETFKNNFKLFKEVGEIHDIHYKLQHTEGHYIDASFEGYAGYDANGKLEKTYCVFKNITFQKRLKISLDQIENRYRNLIHASINHIFMLTPDGYYMLSNDRVRQFGFERGSQLIGRNVMEVHELDTGKFYQHKIDEVLRSEKPVTFEHTLHTKEQLHYHLDTLYPMLENGNVHALGGICRDITKQKRKEIDLQEREAELSTILQNAPVMLATIDKDQDELKVFQIAKNNDGEEKNNKLDTSQFLKCFQKNEQAPGCVFGMDCENCVIHKIIQETFKTGQPHFQEEIKLVLNEDPKKERWYLVSTVPVEIDGNTRILLSMLDITERKTSEIQLQSTMQYLSNLEENFRQHAAQKLHDQVGQNLTALTFNLDYISNQLSEDIDKILVNKFDDSLNLLNNTIECIRDIISEMRPSVLEDYGLFAALKWYGKKFSDRTGINVIVDGQEVEDRLSNSKEAALFRIVQELFNNAAKYSKAENILVELKRNQEHVRLRVRDNGIGFNKEEIEDNQGPTGLGILSMEDRINALGGEFELHSAPDQGTEIIIKLEI